MLSHLNAPLKLGNFIKKKMLAMMTGHFFIPVLWYAKSKK